MVGNLETVTCTFYNSVSFTPSPGMTIDKTWTIADGGSVVDEAGDVINYTITLVNTGNQGITNVVVTDPLLGSLSGPTGDIDEDGVLDANESVDNFDSDGDGKIDAAETWVYTGSYTVTQADMDGNGVDLNGAIDGDGDVDNTATATSDQVGPITDTEIVPLTQTPGLAIDKTSATTSISAPGTIDYTIEAWNTGNVTLTGVTVSDPLLGSLSCTWPGADGVLPVGDGAQGGGDTVTCTGSYEATQADVDAGDDIVNTATADSNETDEVTDDHTVTITQDPSVVVTKSADPTEISAPGTIDYTVTVFNDGNVSLVPSISDLLNSGLNTDLALTLTLDPASDVGSDGVLSVGETWTYTTSYDVTQADIDDGSNLVNVACVADVDGDGSDECDDATTTITQDPSVVVTKSADPTEISAPGTIDYTVTVFNDGNVSLVPSISDLLNSGLNTDLALTLTLDPASDVGSDGVLSVGETWTYTTSYDVTQADIDDGSNLVNVACVADVDGDGSDECDDATTTITQDPSVVVTKSADPTEISAPGTIDYTVTVFNDGNVSLVPSISDLLNSGLNTDLALTLTLDPASDVGSDGVLSVGETWTYTTSYDVTQADIDDGSNLVNVACVADVDGDGSDECDDATTTITQDPNADVEKSTDVEYYSAVGDVIDYTISVENTGNVSLSQADVEATLSDELNGVDVTGDLAGPFTDAAGTNPAAGALAVGGFWYYTYSYTIVEADLADGSSVTNVVCIDVDGDGAEDCSTVETPLAGLDIVKKVTAIDNNPDATSADSAGDIIEYEIVVTNTGAIDLSPSVSDILTQSGVDETLTLGTPHESQGGDGVLEPTETWTFTVSYEVTQADIDDGGAIVNEACAFNTDPDVVEECSDVTTPITQDPAMSVVKTVDQAVIDGPTTLTYDITVTNDGNVTMYPSMSDILNASGVDSPVDLGDPVESVNTDGDLDVGETWTFQFTYDVTQDDIDDGTAILNTVCISDTPDADDCDDATTTITQDPAMSVVKTVDQAVIDGPTTLTYDITVTNDGNVTMYPSMSDILNASGVDSPVDLGDPVESVNTDGDLDVGETWTFQFTYDVTQDDIDDGTAILNTVCISDTPDADDCDDATTTITQDPAMSVVKTVDQAVIDGPTTLTYDITVTNDGNVTMYPSMSDILNASGVDSPVDLGDPVESVNTDGDLDVGETWTFQFTYDVTQDDIDDGTAILNTVCISDTPDADDCDDATTTITQLPDATVVKSADKATVSAAGEVITYTVTVDNTGNVTLDPAADVSLTDALNGAPVVLSYDSGDSDGDGLIDVDETWIYTGSYTVTQDDMDAGVDLVNVACIGDVDGNGIDDADECDDATTTITQLPDATVVKSADKATVSAAGEVITYTVTVDNTGNVTLDPAADVSLTDALNGAPVVLSYDSGDSDGDGLIDVDETWIYTGSYTVTQDDMDAGVDLVNVACIGDVDGNGIDDADECDDATTTITQLPDATVVKSADKATVSAAGEVITYTVTVDNTGNVTLDPAADVSLTDALNGAPVVLSYDSGDSDGDGLIDVDETWIYTGSYTVTQDDMDAGVDLVNVACIGDVDGNGIDDADECDDATTTITQLPAHTFVKTFDPDTVGVGETGSFTLVYTNTGNVTLNNVEISDAVEPILDVTSVSSTAGTCPNNDGNDQTITCNVGSLAPGESVTITVTYLAAPLVDDLVPGDGQTSGANYVFYFENGYVLYGSTGDGTAYLQDPAGNVTEADVEGRNQDIYFNAPFGGDGFQLHLSCSEVFIDGWGDTGPTEEDDPEWRIDAYEVHRFNTNGFFKDCGQTFAPFEVENEASATATPAGGTLSPNPITAEDTVTLINIAPIEVTRNRVRRGDVEIQYFNTSYEDIEIDIIRVEWDDTSVMLEGASYKDGVDLGISGCNVVDGKCVLQASIDTIMPDRSKDWLKLSFDSNDAPDGLTITIVTSTGATLTYVYP